MTTDLKLGLQLGYWTAQPPAGRDLIELAQKAEALGYDSVWTGESWGSDAFSPLAWAAARTPRIAGTGHRADRRPHPATMAMHAMTLDRLSGRAVRWASASAGPQVVEGWYGRPFGKPLARDPGVRRRSCARPSRREGPVDDAGPHYPLPYSGEGAVGLGKPLKMITHPLRADVPIYLGAEGPKNVRARVRDRRRVGAALLVAVPRRVYADRCRRTRRLRDRRERPVVLDDDVGRGAAAGQGDARLLHRRHGRQGRATSTPS